MKVITHKGITYTKATVLAKELGYTTDYLGQLSRAKKVEARLVGRAWYVSKESLLRHKKGRYRQIGMDDKSTKSDSKSYLSHIDIEPVLSNKTIKIISNLADPESTLTYKYEPDEGSLIPTVTKPKKTDPVKVTEVEGRKVTILRPEPREEVVLMGSIAVRDVHEKAAIPVETAGNDNVITKSLAARPPAPRVPEVAKKEEAHQIILKKDGSRSSIIRPRKPLNNSHIGKKGEINHRFTPHAVVAKHSGASATVSNNFDTKSGAEPSKTEKSKKTRKGWFVFIVLSAILISLVMLTLRTEQISVAGSSSEKMIFDISILKKIVIENYKLLSPF